jgi:hypothetical protein
MREKLRSLKASDPTFWAELCKDVATNVPKEGDTVLEDDITIDDDSVGDDSAIGVAEVVAEVLNLNLKGGRVDAKMSGLVLSNFAEDGGEAPMDNLNPGPSSSMNVLTSNPGPSSEITTGERSKRKHIANRWYPMKNFIRHDDDSEDSCEDT